VARPPHGCEERIPQWAEVVYVKQPFDFVVVGNEDKVYHLHKALYGLRQAPRVWNAKLDATCIGLGFQRSCSENGVYTRSRGGDRLIIRVYIDKLIITGTTESAIDEFKQEMKEKFQMSDLGLLSYYLGIEVIQGEAGIALCQSAYVGKLIERCGLSSCNSAMAPMENRLKLSKESTEAPVDATEYHSIIGALRYLLHMCPELTFVVEYLSRFMEELHGDHHAAVKRVMRYVADTRDLRLFYTKQEEGPPKAHWLQQR
jgi:hypothetical protein